MLTNAAYFRTLTLRERSRLLKARRRSQHAPTLPARFTPTADAPGAASSSAARRREMRWRERCGAGDHVRFIRRLAAEGLSVEEAPLLLDSEAASIQCSADRQSDWLDGINPVVSPLPEDNDIASTEPFQGFLGIASPQLADAERSLLHRLERLPGLSRFCTSPRDFVRLATPTLAADFAERIARVLVLELNVMRLQGDLAGATGDERFQDFLGKLHTPHLRDAVFEEYPVLLRLLRQTADQWTNHWFELAQRLIEDHAVIEQTLLDGTPLGNLREAVAGAGDRHRGGRHVTILGFESGHRVVYKPRALSVDIAYQKLLTWLAQGVGDPAMVRTRHLARDTYGWSAYIEHTPCASREQVATFYRRLGMQLALLYALDATDMHLENLIAHGDTPVLVDLEALFHPRLGTGMQSAGPAPAIVDNGWGSYYDSVMRVGLLPSWSYPNDDGEAVELSGIGGAGGQWMPDEQPVFAEIGRDTMHIARARLRLAAAKNQPFVDDERVDPGAFAECVVTGFQDAYGCLLTHRDLLLRPDGLLAAFRHVEVRAVLRHTKVYATLLRDSYHPDLLRDAIDRDIHFEALWRSLEARPWFAQVIRHELADLWRGDIPHFTTRPTSTSLWTSEGEEIPGLFVEEAYTTVQRRIGTLSIADCERQSWFIRASLAALDAETHATPVSTSSPERSAPTPVDGDMPAPATPPAAAATPGVASISSWDLRARALHHAGTIADRLVTLALERENEVNWLGVSLVNEKHWSLQPLRDDLYDGRLGVALALLEIDRALGHPRARELARVAIEACASRYGRVVDHEPQQSSGSNASPESFLGGAFQAFGGGAFVLTHAAQILGEPRYARLAQALVQRAAQSIANDEQLDVIAGTAGFALVGAALFERHAHPELRPILHEACRHLIAHAIPQHTGVAWRSRIDAERPLTGFSHGASGIAFALLRASHLLQEPEYLEVGRQALCYERHCYDHAGGYWPDYRRIAVRSSEGAWPTMYAWCHGAPGIGLARLRILEQSQQDEPLITMARQDLRHALWATRQHGFLGNHSLCHGMLGNFALIDEATRAGVDEETASVRDTIAERILDSIERTGAQCGIPRGIETPGLMTGLAGIALGLLQMAGERVADVLTLTLPERHTP